MSDELLKPVRAQAYRGGRLVAIVMVCAAVALWSSPAAAQSPRGAAAQDKVIARQCEADLRARCDVVSGGQDSIRACIKQQFDELGDACRTWLAGVAAVNKACAADIKQSCANAQGGHGRIVACLKSALGQLSEPCKDALARSASGKR